MNEPRGYLIPWQDIIGKDRLDELIKTAFALAEAEKNNRYPDAWAKVKDKDWYEERRSLMHKAGWTEDDTGRFTGWTGYFGFIVRDSHGNPNYRRIIEDPTWITMTRFLDFKRGLDQSKVETEYYGDPDFPPEEDTNG